MHLGHKDWEGHFRERKQNVQIPESGEAFSKGIFSVEELRSF